MTHLPLFAWCTIDEPEGLTHKAIWSMWHDGSTLRIHRPVRQQTFVIRDKKLQLLGASGLLTSLFARGLPDWPLCAEDRSLHWIFHGTVTHLQLTHYDRKLNEKLLVTGLTKYSAMSTTFWPCTSVRWVSHQRKLGNSFTALFINHVRSASNTEFPVNSELLSLDLNLHFGAQSVCWKCLPCSRKSLRSFSLAHFHFGKSGIVQCALRSSREKSCNQLWPREFQWTIIMANGGGIPSLVNYECIKTLFKRNVRG